jgi:hypothetical protein
VMMDNLLNHFDDDLISVNPASYCRNLGFESSLSDPEYMQCYVTAAHVIFLARTESLKKVPKDSDTFAINQLILDAINPDPYLRINSAVLKARLEELKLRFPLLLPGKMDRQVAGAEIKNQAQSYKDSENLKLLTIKEVQIRTENLDTFYQYLITNREKNAHRLEELRKELSQRDDGIYGSDGELTNDTDGLEARIKKLEAQLESVDHKILGYRNRKNSS